MVAGGRASERDSTVTVDRPAASGRASGGRPVAGDRVGGQVGGPATRAMTAAGESGANRWPSGGPADRLPMVVAAGGGRWRVGLDHIFGKQNQNRQNP
ncbi:uncharacterized protein A4U43_C07F17570 [Asparagus officinalis]|uniref:Uncharacterized protein n=1 Tax=Asparagus officinalis TaxID=4686 RepID=A0A5P1EHX1_ASPOF|nr:uncharacterized protein A4U43_C07F17570 [Asparagus officinalis]